jgi:tetratricopeptide (TPR) repeat protein
MSCGSSENTQEFITSTTGRYLINTDETIEVYFVEQELRLKWRGQDVVPMKLNDSTFYVKQMNEKLIFSTQPKSFIKLAPKKGQKNKASIFRKLKNGEKTPGEYLANKEFENALQGYLAIKKKDSLDPNIKEGHLNDLGYAKLRSGKHEEAIAVFKINVRLYPHKSNPYDSLGEAYWAIKDTSNALENYKKSLDLDPDNSRARRFIRKHKKN